MQFILFAIHGEVVTDVILTTPIKQNITATNLDNVNLSPLDDGKNAAKTRVKNVDVELSKVTMAASLGSRASWNK